MSVSATDGLEYKLVRDARGGVYAVDNYSMLEPHEAELHLTDIHAVTSPVYTDAAIHGNLSVQGSVNLPPAQNVMLGGGESLQDAVHRIASRSDEVAELKSQLNDLESTLQDFVEVVKENRELIEENTRLRSLLES